MNVSKVLISSIFVTYRMNCGAIPIKELFIIFHEKIPTG
jgi:hypothetical protein